MLPWIKIDWPLLLCLLLLCALSMVVLYSASGANINILINQGVRMLVAFTVMLVFAQIRPDIWFRWTPIFFTIGLLLLVLVLAIGYTGKGATRWLDLKVFRFQPSEMMKLAVPMMLAWLMTQRTLPPTNSSLFYAALILILPTLLILKQPDLGTALMILMSGAVIIFLSGFAWRSIGILLVLAGICAPFAWHFLHDYQKLRVLTLFDPWADPLGAGYHSIQSMIAIGSGGLQGKGWLKGSQSQLEFIPERHTDFVFSVYSEELGFIGVFMLLLLYVLIAARGLYIAYMAKDTYSRLLAGSLSMTFFFYVFVNIGMVSGMLPVVGVPLPIISYGGTSMVTLMAGFGLLMGIHRNRNLIAN